MPNYIQLLTLTTAGRARVLKNPSSMLQEQNAIKVSGVQVLGQYAVLGEFDFVNIIEAPDNDAVARFSIELGVRIDAHIVTLPAIPVGLLEERPDQVAPDLEADVRLQPPRV